MKAILLAGGSGTRLHPVTFGVSKQMLPIYDKPMIYYPLSVLMLSGIRDILVITTPEEQGSFKRLLGNGEEFGIRLDYKVQQQPNGIAESFLIGKEFIGKNSVCLALGDNIFFGQAFQPKLRKVVEKTDGATVFAHRVKDPTRFGVVEFDSQGRAISLEEKPAKPASNYAVTGLYFYDNNVVDFASSISPSNRGELEITDINKIYLNQGLLDVEVMGRGFAWLDTGTHESLLEASSFVQTIENTQGLKVACLEEIAFNNGWISSELIASRAHALRKTSYGAYLSEILESL